MMAVPYSVASSKAHCDLGPRRSVSAGVFLCWGLALATTGCGGGDNATDARTKGHEDYKPQRVVSTPEPPHKGMGVRLRRTQERKQRKSSASQPRPRQPLPLDPTADRNFPRAAPLPEPRTSKDLRRQFRQIERIAKLPHTRKAGCRRIAATQGPPLRLLGPPGPRSAARLVGDTVVVNFEFTSLSQSRACRPFVVDVVVLAHDHSNRHHETGKRVLVRGRRGRVEVPLSPREGGPPYYVRVRALGHDLRPGPDTKVRLD